MAFKNPELGVMRCHQHDLVYLEHQKCPRCEEESAKTSSAASTETGQATPTVSQDYVGSFVKSKKRLAMLASQSGTPLLECSHIATGMHLQHMSGQLDTLTTLLAKLMTALNAPASSALPPAPSSSPSTPPAASDVDSLTKSPAPSNSGANKDSSWMRHTLLHGWSLQEMFLLEKVLSSEINAQILKNQYLRRKISDTTALDDFSTSVKAGTGRKPTI